MAVLLLLPFSVAQAQQALPRIVGTDLQGASKLGIDISIDGANIDVTGFNRGGFIPDVDGDGIVEAFLNASEPGQLWFSCLVVMHAQPRSVRPISVHTLEYVISALCWTRTITLCALTILID